MWRKAKVTVVVVRARIFLCSGCPDRSTCNPGVIGSSRVHYSNALHMRLDVVIWIVEITQCVDRSTILGTQL